MPYTLWHSGVLIGETDFEGERDERGPRGRPRRHLVGMFRPTAYGRLVLPRLCGMLTAMAELKDEVVRRGLDIDDVPPDTFEELFGTTAAGAHIVDVGRVLSEVELHAPSGRIVEFASMGFMDLGELASLSRKLCGEELVKPSEGPASVPEFLVSVTLRKPDRSPWLGMPSPPS